MLNDAISEVKKLNDVQQLTATITPPSMINMMSNDEDHCFQCQEHGHRATNCPNIRCFECDECGHTVMDCLYRIPPLGTPAKHHQSKSHKSLHTKSNSRQHLRTGAGEVIPGHGHISTDTTAQVIMVCIETAPDHDIEMITTTPEAVHIAPVPHTEVTAIDSTTTHHIDHTTDHPHTKAHPLTTPEIEVDHICIHPTIYQDEINVGHTHTPVDHEANHIT